LHKAALEIARVVKVWLTVDETAALQDFVYNLGIGNFESSTLLRKLNAGDYAGAAAQIDLWDHAGGRVVAGLLRRRQVGTALFLESDESCAKAA
jgi:lysozyme